MAFQVQYSSGSSCFSNRQRSLMRGSCGAPLRLILLALLASIAVSCQTLRQVSNLKDVQFRIDRATNVQLAGIDLGGVRSVEDVSGIDMARLGSALSRGELPLSFTLFVEAENPASNSVDARLTQMDWTLLLDDTETISGTSDREVVLPPGTPKEVGVDIDLDLVEFFDRNLQSFLDLATAVAGDGPPANLKLRVRPIIQTPIGRMKYPTPITVVSKDVGGQSESAAQ